MPDKRTNPHKMGLLRKVALCLCMLVLSAGQVSGYVLDGRHILELMLDKMDLPGQMRVDQVLTVFDERFETGQLEIAETAWYKIPENFRTEIQTKNLNRIYLASGDETLTVLDGKIVSQDSNPIYHYKDLFCFRNRQSLADHLAYLGMNVSKSSYGRWEGTVAYVIGAQYPDESKPQLWVEKSSFLPIRWIFQVDHPSVGQDRVEFRYKDWQQTEGAWYPGLIEIIQGKGLSRRIDLQDIEINPPFTDVLFNIDHLRGLYSETGLETEPSESENDIDQQIKEFRDIFESE